MDCQSAVQLIDQLVFFPGWTIEATDMTARFEGAVVVKITYPTFLANRSEAPEYRTPISPSASFTLMVDRCDDTDVYRQILGCTVCIWEHEAREALRVHPTMWAPFHPHRADGMRRWGTPATDLTFGIA